MASSPKLSDYAKRLEIGARTRYLEKISVINIDPYLITDLPKELVGLPPTAYTDIGHYFIYTTSTYTAKQLKAKKSLESYQNFLDGWVLEVRCKKYKDEGIYLVKGKVCLQ